MSSELAIGASVVFSSLFVVLLAIAANTIQRAFFWLAEHWYQIKHTIDNIIMGLLGLVAVAVIVYAVYCAVRFILWVVYGGEL